MTRHSGQRESLAEATAIGIVRPVPPTERGGGTATHRLSRRRRISGLAAALLGIVAAANAHAQGALASAGTPPVAPSPPAPAAVSFVIDRIVVEGARNGAERIVAAETLLKPGNTYSEQQILEALRRVERLPFVVEATPSLRRGIERGHFELVITIRQAWPVFFGGTMTASHERTRFQGDRAADTVGLDTEVGGRVFIGGYHELSASVTGLAALKGWPEDVIPRTSDRSRFLLGGEYRHHDLFGRHVLGQAFVRQTVRESVEAGVALAAPLSAASAVRVSVSGERSAQDYCGDACSHEKSRARSLHLALSWQRDTTDDPFAPREGSRVAIEVSGARSSSTFHYIVDLDYPPSGEERQDAEFRSGQIEATLSARRYWPVSSHLAVGFAVDGSVLGSESQATWTPSLPGDETASDGSRVEGKVGASLLGTFGNAGSPLWWTLTGTLAARHHSYSVNVDLDYFPLHYGNGDVAIAFALAGRGRWGIARLELSYVHRLWEP